MNVKYFESFKEASALAKELAIRYGLSIRVSSEGSGFTVETPQVKFSNEKNKPDTKNGPENLLMVDESLTPESLDDCEDNLDCNEHLKEKLDYGDSISRSNEDGWFYDKTDGDWENNLIDPDSE